MEIYLARDDTQAGPFSTEQVAEMIRSGSVEKTDQIWHEGLPTWRCLGMMSEYSAAFEAATAVSKPAEGENKEVKSPAAKAPSAPASAAAVPSSGDSAPIPYNPDGAPPPTDVDDSALDEILNKKENVPASRAARFFSATVDGLVIWFVIWILSAVFLPSGLGLTDLAGGGGYQGEYRRSYSPSDVEQQWDALGDNFTQEEFAEVLGQFAKPVGANDALSIADRYNRGELTNKEQKQIMWFGLAVLISVMVIGITQMVLLSIRGQSIGKMFLGIRIIRDPSMEPAKFVHACLLRVFVPGMIKAIPFIGGLFALVDVLCIFGAERKCLHDRIASTAVVKA